MRYEQVIDGEWFKLTERTMRQMCCDCHLVHEWQFRVNPDGTLSMRLCTDRQATRRARKRYNVEVIRGQK